MTVGISTECRETDEGGGVAHSHERSARSWALCPHIPRKMLDSAGRIGRRRGGPTAPSVGSIPQATVDVAGVDVVPLFQLSAGVTTGCVRVSVGAALSPSFVHVAGGYAVSPGGDDIPSWTR
jgi:hypothetical protein